MKITGQILKENRERKGVTLTEVSLATKITTKTLASIEDGNPANLPPKTFLRGFVRAYAVYLGVDADEILRTFHEEMGSTLSRPVIAGPNPSELNSAATEIASGENEGSGDSLVAPNSAGLPPVKTKSTFSRDTTRPKPENDRRAQATKRIDAEATLRNETSLLTRGGIIGGILLLIVLIVFIKGKMDSYESERASGPADPATVETAAPSAALETASTAASGTADVSTEAEESLDEGEQTAAEPAAGLAVSGTKTREGDGGIPGAPALLAAPLAITPTPKPSPTPTPKPSPTPTPKPSPTPTPSATPATSASPKPSATPKPVGSAPAGKSHEILIEALDQVDIEVTVDGEAPRSIKLKGEQVQSIRVKRKATLKLSDGGAVNLIVNGVDRGVPGDLGKPTRVELP